MTVQEVTGKQETLPPTRILRRRGGLRHAVTLRVITGGLGILVAAVLYLPARVVPQPLRLVLERTVTALVDQLPDSPPLKLSFVPPSNGPQPAPGSAVWVSDTSGHSGPPNSAQPPAVGVQPSPTPSQLAVVSGLSASPPELPTATPAPPVVLPLVQGNQAAVTAPPPPTAAPVPVPTAAPTTAPTSPPTAVPVTTPAPTPRHSPKPKPTPTPTPTAVPVSVPAAAIPDPTASPSQAAPSPTGGVASPSPSPSASPLP